MSEFLIKSINLCKNYGKNTILDNINLCIEKGDILGLIGKNGAGKTTLIRIILSLASATSGKVEFLSKDKITVGGLVESPAFYSYLSATENLEYYRLLNGIKSKTSVKEMLDFVGLNNTKNKKFKDFSLGMKQRLAIALALINNPDLLVLDEPINGLDPMGIKEIRDLLLKINKEKGTTILISSHILSELSQLANTYAFIDKGKIIEEISSDDLDDKCKSCLRIKVDNSEKARYLLNEKLNIKAIDLIDNNTLYIYDYLDKPNIINKMLIQSGIELFFSDFNETSLEDYFLNLIGGAING